MEWIELGKLIEFQKKSKIKAGDGKTEGKYLMYTSSMLVDKYLDEYQYSEEALIMGTGGNASIHYSSGKFGTSTDCYVIYNKGAKALLKYIYYYLLGNIYILEEGFRGAGLKHTNQKYIKNIKIPILSVEAQEKIVKVLDQAQALIDKRKEQIEALDQLIESIFYTMFGDPVRNEKGWEVKRLKDITSKIGSGSTPRGGESSYKESGISLIRSMNVYDNKFKYDGLAYIDEEQAKLLSNVIVENNDILINITGASITRTTIVPKNILPARVNQHVSILRCNNQVAHIYLLHLLISKKYKQKIYYISTSSGATREALTKVNLENLEIPIPPISLQNEFAQKVESIEKQKEVLGESLELMEENYKSIMDKAFKGQLFN